MQFRIVVEDCAAVKPSVLDPAFSPLTGKPLSRVPVVRLFGTVSGGQQAVLHVHGYLPYFYVGLNDQLESAFLSRSDGEEGQSVRGDLLRQLALEIDDALSQAGQGKGGETSSSSSSSSSVRQAGAGRDGSGGTGSVFDLQLCKRRSLYGYHPKPSLFLKVTVCLPQIAQKVASLFHSGRLGQRASVRSLFPTLPRDALQLQPFELHLPYLLQFLIDHDLRGMTSVPLPMETVFFRKPRDETAETETASLRPSPSPPVPLFFSRHEFHPNWSWIFKHAERLAVIATQELPSITECPEDATESRTQILSRSCTPAPSRPPVVNIPSSASPGAVGDRSPPQPVTSTPPQTGRRNGSEGFEGSLKKGREGDRIHLREETTEEKRAFLQAKMRSISLSHSAPTRSRNKQGTPMPSRPPPFQALRRPLPCPNLAEETDAQGQKERDNSQKRDTKRPRLMISGDTDRVHLSMGVDHSSSLQDPPHSAASSAAANPGQQPKSHQPPILVIDDDDDDDDEIEDEVQDSQQSPHAHSPPIPFPPTAGLSIPPTLPPPRSSSSSQRSEERVPSASAAASGWFSRPQTPSAPPCTPPQRTLNDLRRVLPSVHWIFRPTQPPKMSPLSVESTTELEIDIHHSAFLLPTTDTAGAQPPKDPNTPHRNANNPPLPPPSTPPLAVTARPQQLDVLVMEDDDEFDEVAGDAPQGPYLLPPPRQQGRNGIPRDIRDTPQPSQPQNSMAILPPVGWPFPVSRASEIDEPSGLKLKDFTDLSAPPICGDSLEGLWTDERKRCREAGVDPPDRRNFTLSSFIRKETAPESLIEPDFLPRLEELETFVKETRGETAETGKQTKGPDVVPACPPFQGPSGAAAALTGEGDALQNGPFFRHTYPFYSNPKDVTEAHLPQPSPGDPSRPLRSRRAGAAIYAETGPSSSVLPLSAVSANPQRSLLHTAAKIHRPLAPVSPATAAKTEKGLLPFIHSQAVANGQIEGDGKSKKKEEKKGRPALVILQSAPSTAFAFHRPPPSPADVAAECGVPLYAPPIDPDMPLSRPSSQSQGDLVEQFAEIDSYGRMCLKLRKVDKKKKDSDKEGKEECQQQEPPGGPRRAAMASQSQESNDSAQTDLAALEVREQSPPLSGPVCSIELLTDCGRIPAYPPPSSSSANETHSPREGSTAIRGGPRPGASWEASTASTAAPSFSSRPSPPSAFPPGTSPPPASSAGFTNPRTSPAAAAARSAGPPPKTAGPNNNTKAQPTNQKNTQSLFPTPASGNPLHDQIFAVCIATRDARVPRLRRLLGDVAEAFRAEGGGGRVGRGRQSSGKSLLSSDRQAIDEASRAATEAKAGGGSGDVDEDWDTHLHVICQIPEAFEENVNGNGDSPCAFACGEVLGGLTLSRACGLTAVRDEWELLDAFVKFVRRIDPDVMLGFETSRHSLGYIVKRAQVLGVPDLQSLLSRIPEAPRGNGTQAQAQAQGAWGKPRGFDPRDEVTDPCEVLPSNWKAKQRQRKNGEGGPVLVPHSSGSAQAVAAAAVQSSGVSAAASVSLQSSGCVATGGSVQGTVGDGDEGAGGVRGFWGQEFIEDVKTNPWMMYAPVLSSGGVQIGGRVCLNLWRLLRSEVKLLQYSAHSLASALLGVSLPNIPSFSLAFAWKFSEPVRSSSSENKIQPGVADGKRRRLRFPSRHLAVRYVLCLAELNLALGGASGVMERNAELSKLFGVDFWSAVSRGTQFRVEAMLARSARQLGYVLLSASKAQVTGQEALECLPLVLEPESSFFADPVAVLDFQSLYPSVVIAYNICYTTCLGRLRGRTAKEWVSLKKNKMGVFEVKVDADVLDQIMERFEEAGEEREGHEGVGERTGDEEKGRARFVNILPNGAVFVSRRVRRGILPSLLQEVLQTRVMVKQAMKKHKGRGTAAQANRVQQLLNARQFGLKYFANVTYGYTGASFSGRMPCGAIADAIVQTARRTLERTIRKIEGTDRWRSRVVYGDTDSVFVHMPGRSLKEAFEIGREIVNAVSAENPWPMELKLEKVYLPSFCVSKKRYVGRCFESPDGPSRLDSKGVETVRRDQSPATSKIMEAVLMELFDSKDLSKVKALLCSQWEKTLKGPPEASLFDFIFHREARIGTYSHDRGGASHTLPPQAVVALASMAGDETSAPHVNERVPFAVAYGPPASRLIDLVVPPHRILGASRPPLPLAHYQRASASPLLDSLSAAWRSSVVPLLQLNGGYYIEKQIIPAIERLLMLLTALFGRGPQITTAAHGAHAKDVAEVRRWFASMRRPLRASARKLPVVPSGSEEHLQTAAAASGGDGRGDTKAEIKIVEIDDSEDEAETEKQKNGTTGVTASVVGVAGVTGGPGKEGTTSKGGRFRWRGPGKPPIAPPAPIRTLSSFSFFSHPSMCLICQNTIPTSEISQPSTKKDAAAPSSRDPSHDAAALPNHSSEASHGSKPLGKSKAKATAGGGGGKKTIKTSGGAQKESLIFPPAPRRKPGPPPKWALPGQPGILSSLRNRYKRGGRLAPPTHPKPRVSKGTRKNSVESALGDYSGPVESAPSQQTAKEMETDPAKRREREVSALVAGLREDVEDSTGLWTWARVRQKGKRGGVPSSSDHNGAPSSSSSSSSTSASGSMRGQAAGQGLSRTREERGETGPVASAIRQAESASSSSSSSPSSTTTTPPPLCRDCNQSQQVAAYRMMQRLRNSESRLWSLSRICVSCAGSAEAARACHEAFHCPVWFDRLNAESGVAEARAAVARLTGDTALPQRSHALQW